MGLQRLLPPRSRQPGRRAETQSRATGNTMSLFVSESQCLTHHSSQAQVKRRWAHRSLLALQIVSLLISKGCIGWLGKWVSCHFLSSSPFFFLIIQQWKNSGEGTLFRFLTLMCILSKINKVPPAHRIHPSGSCRRSCRPLSHPTPSTLTYHAASRGCKISLARCGGVTHWALTPDEDDSIMTVAWGQNAANGAFLPGAFALSSPYVKIL